MILLLPTSDAHAPIAQISAALLDRYWAGHPALHVLHHAVRPRIASGQLHDCGRQEQSSWLATMTAFLRAGPDELFILLLDDYALCGPARVEWIDRGARLMLRDESIGLFPLCWYPAGQRRPREDCAGVVTLGQTPILLQAAIWRRSWFLALAERIGPDASPWGFEAAATQAAKRCPAAICAIDIAEPRWLGGPLVDGFDKSGWPLPYHNLMHRGQPRLEYETFLHREGFAFPSRGLGDTAAKAGRALGAPALAHAIEKITGKPCGCARRREKLNSWIPY